MGVINRATGATHLARLERAGFGLTQYRVLRVLRRSANPLSVKELAERLLLSPAATSRAVDSLVRRRLLARDESEIDRRHRLVSLTEEGSRMLARLDDARVREVCAFLAKVPPAEREALVEAARPFLEAASQTVDTDVVVVA